MKKAIRKTILSMTMALALVATAIPFTAMAAEPETLRTPEVLIDLNGFIGKDAEKKYDGTSTPHDGIDAYDENFLSECAFGWDDNSWMTFFIYVGEGSSMNISLRPDYTGGPLYITPSVSVLDDDGHIAYTVETFASGGEEITATPKTIFKFDNIEPMQSLEMSNGLMVEPGKIRPEKMIFTISIYTDNGRENRVALYNFMIQDDGAAKAYDESKFTYATGTALEVPVDRNKVVFEAYNINQNNYVKLRDVAQALTGSAKQFNVTWDGGKQAINLVSNQAYVSVGGELPVNAKLAEEKAEHEKWQAEHPNMTVDVNTGLSFYAPQSQNTTLNTSKIYLDGKEVSLTAYTINGNNYFKLRDLGELFDFGVSWDGATNTVSIDTSKGYTAG